MTSATMRYTSCNPLPCSNDPIASSLDLDRGFTIIGSRHRTDSCSTSAPATPFSSSNRHMQKVTTVQEKIATTRTSSISTPASWFSACGVSTATDSSDHWLRRLIPDENFLTMSSLLVQSRKGCTKDTVLLPEASKHSCSSVHTFLDSFDASSINSAQSFAPSMVNKSWAMFGEPQTDCSAAVLDSQKTVDPNLMLDHWGFDVEDDIVKRKDHPPTTIWAVTKDGKEEDSISDIDVDSDDEKDYINILLNDLLHNVSFSSHPWDDHLEDPIDAFSFLEVDCSRRVDHTIGLTVELDNGINT